MIALIFFLSIIGPFLFLFTSLAILKFRQSIKQDIRWGKRCWYCKEEIPEFWKDVNSLLKNSTQCCNSCKRDIRIAQISSPLKSVFIKFQMFLISSKFQNLLFTLIGLNLVLLVIYITSIIFNFKYFTLITFMFWFFTYIFWILLIGETWITSIKKEKPSK